MLQNFRVIMKYNPAEAYALAIGHFADRLRGGAPFVQPWPRQERELSRAERLELQQLLAQRGFYRGTPDGQFGGETRNALRSFQASIGAPADGFASSDVLERLRGGETPVARHPAGRNPCRNTDITATLDGGGRCPAYGRGICPLAARFRYYSGCQISVLTMRHARYLTTKVLFRGYSPSAAR